MWSVVPVQSGFSCLSLTKFSRNSLERLPIRPYNASTNYNRITKFSRWLRWDGELAHRLVASNQPDLLVIQAASRRRALKSQRAKAKGGPMTKHLLGLILLGSALLLSAPAHAFGQAVYGSITGNVVDSNGAAVSSAKVTITDTGKG